MATSPRFAAGELQEHAAGLAALVELPRGVQEARPVAERRGHAQAVAQVQAHALQDALMLLGRRQVSLQGHVVARPHGAQQLAQRRRQTVVADRGRRSPAVGPGGDVGQPPSLTYARSRRLVLSLLSATLGWSNGSMPSTAPAAAATISQRTNSAPTSQMSDRVRVMVG